MSDLYESIKNLEQDETSKDSDRFEKTKKRAKQRNKNGTKRKYASSFQPSSIFKYTEFKNETCEEKIIYSCTEEGCNKSYTQKYRLLIHQRVHTGEKPYECIICKKNFTEKGNLKVHLRIHTGERPYKCEFVGCKKSFKAYGQLKDHKNVHTNKKEYNCSICTAKFSRRSTLKMHHLIHTNEKPYHCPYNDCQKTFREKSNLNKHIKVHMKNLEKMKKNKGINSYESHIVQNKNNHNNLRYDKKHLEISRVGTCTVNNSEFHPQNNLSSNINSSNGINSNIGNIFGNILNGFPFLETRFRMYTFNEQFNESNFMNDL